MSDATITATKEALDEFAYPTYTALSATQKLAVAEEINKLTKTVSGSSVALDFSGEDKVTTIKQANDYVAAAVNKVVGN